MKRQDLDDTILELPVPAAILEVLADEDEFRLARVNSALIRFLRTEDDPVGRLTRDFVFSPNAGERVRAGALICRDSAETYVSEETFVLRGGRVVSLRLTFVPYMEAGSVSTIFATLDDTTALSRFRTERARELALAASGFVEICAWCNSVADKEAGWQPPDVFVEGVRRDRKPRRTLCPSCALKADT